MVQQVRQFMHTCNVAWRACSDSLCCQAALLFGSAWQAEAAASRACSSCPACKARLGQCSSTASSATPAPTQDCAMPMLRVLCIIIGNNKCSAALTAQPAGLNMTCQSHGTRKLTGAIVTIVTTHAGACAAAMQEGLPLAMQQPAKNQISCTSSVSTSWKAWSICLPPSVL